MSKPEFTHTTFYFIRHGETAHNSARLLQGHLDIPLNEHGEKQARAAGKGLILTNRAHCVDVIVASDLKRASQTAAIIADAIADAGHPRPEVIPDVRLRERGLGIFQGKTPVEAAQAHPDDWEKYRALQPVDFKLPGGGESIQDLHQRVTECINELASRYRGKHVLITTHGGVLSTVFRYVVGLPMHASRKFSLVNAAINEIHCTDTVLGNESEWVGEEGDEQIDHKRAWKIQGWGIVDHLAELGFIHL